MEPLSVGSKSDTKGPATLLARSTVWSALPCARLVAIQSSLASHSGRDDSSADWVNALLCDVVLPIPACTDRLLGITRGVPAFLSRPALARVKCLRLFRTFLEDLLESYNISSIHPFYVRFISRCLGCHFSNSTCKLPIPKECTHLAAASSVRHCFSFPFDV